jgi:hypothetical protein
VGHADCQFHRNRVGLRIEAVATLQDCTLQNCNIGVKIAAGKAYLENSTWALNSVDVDAPSTVSTVYTDEIAEDLLLTCLNCPNSTVVPKPLHKAPAGMFLKSTDPSFVALRQVRLLQGLFSLHELQYVRGRATAHELGPFALHTFEWPLRDCSTSSLLQ